MATTPSRRRIAVTEQKIVARAISGGIQITAGNLAWGPDFGQVGSWYAEAAIAFDDVKFTATLSPQATVDLASVDLDGMIGAAGTIDLFEIALAGETEAQAAVALDDLALEGSVAAASAIDLFAVDPTGNLVSPATVDLDSLDLDSDIGSSGEWRTQLEVDDWLANEDVWLDEANPNTNHDPTIFLEARAQSPLASDRKHAYILWDVTGNFSLDGASEEPTVVDEATFVIYVTHDGGLATNPAQLFYELQVRGPDKPFDETTATWNGDEEPPGATIKSGSVTVDNTATADGTHLGRNLYRIEISSAGNSFKNALFGNTSFRYWYLRLLGDTRLGQDNVEFEILGRDGGSQTDNLGREMRPTLNFQSGEFG